MFYYKIEEKLLSRENKEKTGKTRYFLIKSKKKTNLYKQRIFTKIKKSVIINLPKIKQVG